MRYFLQFLLMIGVLAGGWLWLRPREAGDAAADVQFVERAEASGCKNVHTMVTLAEVFDNIMPWLSSVGAAAAAADYDGDGDADLYVTNSGRGNANRLFRNRGDGTFEDVTAAAGVGCGNPEGASVHAIWGDIDGDGDLDLYVLKWAEPNQLFRNNSERAGETPAPQTHDVTFTDISKQAGVDFWGYGNGGTFLDYDRDGRLDILVGNYFPDQIQDPKTGEMVRNDLWHPVTTRVMHETFTHAANGGRNVLYHNKGDGTFEDVAAAVGMTFTGWSLSVGSGDLNNDNWPDVYVANDFGPDEYYLNTGATEDPPRFRLVVDPRGHPGVGHDWWKGMNVDMGDVNNDGYLDMYVTNILEKRYKTDEGNMLWLNCGDAECPGGRGFKNIAMASGTMDGGWGWGGKFADFNNDGLMDIYTVNGFVTGNPDHNYWYQVQEMVTQTKNQTSDSLDWPVMGDRDLSGHERGRLFMQVPGGEGSEGLRVGGSKGDEKTHPSSRSNPETLKPSNPSFIECAERSGISDRYNGRGIAVADFNLDGWLDMYIANQGAPGCYYVNVGAQTPTPAGAAARSFIRLALKGRPDRGFKVGQREFYSTVEAVGARATVETEAGRQIREVQGGMGFSSQSEHTLHFGVPDPDTIRRVTIRWPSGRVQLFEGSAAKAMLGRTTSVVEPVEAVVP